MALIGYVRMSNPVLHDIGDHFLMQLILGKQLLSTSLGEGPVLGNVQMTVTSVFCRASHVKWSCRQEHHWEWNEKSTMRGMKTDQGGSPISLSGYIADALRYAFLGRLEDK